ncbi:hypothetical protein PAEPH01_1345 [Pancytospora epiphaga]|nr:hypothetical protein PAEPH01_1345 [Pancytospora epiphaga]
MSSLKEYIGKQLELINIKKDYSAKIQELTEQNIISEDMPHHTAYNVFLNCQAGSDHLIFKAILKKQYLFDITFSLTKNLQNKDLCVTPDISTEKKCSSICANIEDTLSHRFGDRSEYIFTDERETEIFVGIKLTDKAYQPLTSKNKKSLNSVDDGRSVPDYLIPYLLISECFKEPSIIKYNEHIFRYTATTVDVDKIFSELIQHLKTIELPLLIASYDLLFSKTSTLPVFQAYLYMGESKNWPLDSEAQDCVKTAMYCQYYTRSPYSSSIDKSYVVFRFKNIYFRVQILAERSRSPKQDAAVALQEYLFTQSSDCIRKARMCRCLLANLGFYPLLIDDFLIDCISLILSRNIVGDAAFIDGLLNFNWELAGKHFSLSSLCLVPDLGSVSATLRVTFDSSTFHCPLPKPAVLANLKNRLLLYKSTGPIIFEYGKSLVPIPLKLSLLDFDEFDFVLSKLPRDGFKKILGAFSSDFSLGTPDFYSFIGKRLHKEATFFYDFCNDILFVNVNEGFEPEFIVKLVIMETSFEYIRTNW